MNEHPRVLPELPREIILQILRAATEQNQMIVTAFGRTISAIPSSDRYRETLLMIIASKNDIRTSLAVSKGIRRDMISLLWRDLEPVVPVLHLARVSLYFPVTSQPATAFSRLLRRDLDDQRRDLCHTVILDPSVSTEYPRDYPRYNHIYKLSVNPGKIMHLFNGLELSTLSRSIHPTIPAVVKGHEKNLTLSSSIQRIPLG